PCLPVRRCYVFTAIGGALAAELNGCSETCRMENGTCYVNGSFVPASEAKISIFDRGFTSGEGVYDVSRSFGHRLFKLDAHIARLYRSLKYTRIDCGMPPAEMTRLSIDIFERNK